jgi:hypothetical protein
MPVATAVVMAAWMTPKIAGANFLGKRGILFRLNRRDAFA